MDTRYLFIDGGCLRATLKNISERYFDGKPLKIDYNRLRLSHAKAFYYDAIPAIKDGESEEAYLARTKERRDLHNHIASLDAYHVYEGDSRVRRKQVQQKEVDVMIAVDMLTHTFRKNMQQATFIASDLDFKPLLDALVREGLFVNLLYPRNETSQNLIDAADARQPLAIDTIYHYLDEECKNLIELPSRQLELKANYSSIDSCLLCDDPVYGEIKFHFGGLRYNVFWQSTENVDCYMKVSGRDYVIIRKYCADLFGISIPEQPPIASE